MTNPTITIHNVETDKVIKREMTAEELTQFEADQALRVAQQEAKTIKAAEKTALLARLGITAEEATLLLS